MPLDYRTVVVTEVCLVLTVGILLVFTSLRNRQMRGLIWWGVAYLVLGGSFISLVGGEATKYLWLIYIGWTMHITASAVMWSAARQFDGHTIRWGWVSAGALTMSLIGLIPGYESSPNLTVPIAALLSGSFLAAAAFEIWRGRGEPLVSRWPAIVLLMLSAVVVMTRVPLILAAPFGVGDFTISSGWLATSLLASLVCDISIAFLVIAMAKERLELHYKKASRTDPLTGLGNRRAFIGLSRRRLRRERRDGLPSAVLMLDLDHFKLVNDRFGHAFGDQVLRVFAKTVQESLRPTDIIGRIGGEEFVALLSGAEAEARAVAERVRIAFAAAAKTVDGKDVGATVSIGIAIAEVGMSDVMQLLGHADEALYLAKAHGRNRVEVAQASRSRLAA